MHSFVYAPNYTATLQHRINWYGMVTSCHHVMVTSCHHAMVTSCQHGMVTSCHHRQYGTANCAIFTISMTFRDIHGRSFGFNKLSVCKSKHCVIILSIKIEFKPLDDITFTRCYKSYRIQ